MGRNYVYLGRRVPDTGKKGLDNLNEVRGIRNAILEDRKTGRISQAKAARRMNLLKLSVMRDRDFRGAKRRRAISAVNKGIRKLKAMNAARRRGRAGRRRR